MSEAVEQVMVIPTELFREVGWFQGFRTETAAYLDRLLDPSVISYRPRDEMERDPSFKQLIPYCVFLCEGQVFSYRRTSGQGESRLHGKRSIGVGGHISTEDIGGKIPEYQAGMRRELEEEVWIDSPYTTELVGLLNDDETDVGRVHLGLVHRITLTFPKVRPRETTMIEAGFAPPEDLIARTDEFETWSQISLAALFGK